MKITKEQLKERLNAPTTPFWESIARKASRVATGFVTFGGSLIAMKVTFPDNPIIDTIVLWGSYLAIAGTVFGYAVKLVSDLTVADHTELKK